MKLLVTGAAGLLGTRTCQMAKTRHHEVYSAYSEHTPQFGTPVKFDITDHRAIRQAFEDIEPDAVVHAAALTDVDKCEREKDLAWKTNVEATSNVARLCKAYECFLLYVSTDYVFSGEKGNYEETDPTGPVNHYGLTKLEGEERVKLFSTEHCIARTSVIFGASPALGKTNIALWLIERLREAEHTNVVADQWNSPTLNTSLAEMILEVVEKRITGTLHLAGATRLSRFEFASNVARTFGLNSKVLKPVSSKNMAWLARRPTDASLSVKKAEFRLESRPLHVGQALEKMREEMGGSVLKSRSVS